MTTCTPLKPFRCWQYRKDSTEPVPKWVVGMGSIHLQSREGWWIVWADTLGYCWYTPAEFAERFRVEEGK
jgi:hypothetical protein